MNFYLCPFTFLFTQEQSSTRLVIQESFKFSDVIFVTVFVIFKRVFCPAKMAPKSVFISGASRGIGLEFVRQLLVQANPPKFLIATCRDPSKATELKKLAASNDCLKVFPLDATKDEDIEAVYNETKALLADDGLNLFINNAGINDKSDAGLMNNMTREKLQSHFNTNSTSKSRHCKYNYASVGCSLQFVLKGN